MPIPIKVKNNDSCFKNKSREPSACNSHNEQENNFKLTMFYEISGLSVEGVNLIWKPAVTKIET